MVQVERPDTDAVVELLHGDGRDYRGLYYLWERQQWEATQVDLSLDAHAWPRLDPILARAVSDATAWSLRRAHAATSVLVAFVDTAPTEEQQVFLTSQLVDEARQLVLLDRYRAEVMGRQGSDMAERLDLLEADGASAGVVREIVEVGRELGAGSAIRLTEALGVYHLGAVGAAGTTMTTSVIDALEARDDLPGWRAGMRLALRDARRHVAFALRVGSDDPSGLSGFERGLNRVVPGIEEMLEQLAGVAPLPETQDLVARSRGSVARWLDAVARRGEG